MACPPGLFNVELLQHTRHSRLHTLLTCAFLTHLQHLLVYAMLSTLTTTELQL